MRRGTISHIDAQPGVCGGRPRIAGHRVRVQDIVTWHESLGLSPDEIVSNHPGLTLGDVYAALAYYHDHHEEIRRDLAGDSQIVSEAQQTHPGKLLRKLIARDDANGPLSS